MTVPSHPLGPDGPEAPPSGRPPRFSPLARAAPILLSALSHSMLVLLFLWIVYTPGRPVEELEFPVQIQIEDEIGNTDDETEISRKLVQEFRQLGGNLEVCAN